MGKSLGIKRLQKGISLPKYESEGASGIDLKSLQEHFIPPGEVRVIKTGLAFDIPEGYEIQIRPRSGLSKDTKLRIPNSPGTIDSDYTGEIKILLENISNKKPEFIQSGQRIAQAVLSKIEKAQIYEVHDELKKTKRSDKGFGSTGNT